MLVLRNDTNRSGEKIRKGSSTTLPQRRLLIHNGLHERKQGVYGNTFQLGRKWKNMKQEHINGTMLFVCLFSNWNLQNFLHSNGKTYPIPLSMLPLRISLLHLISFSNALLSYPLFSE